MPDSTRPEPIDWDLAVATARRLAPKGPDLPADETRAAVAMLRQYIAELRRHGAPIGNKAVVATPAPAAEAPDKKGGKGSGKGSGKKS